MAGSKEPADKLEDRMVRLAPLLKILECPVCLEVVKIPFTSCLRGHLVCNECMTKLRSCPSCEGVFSIDSPISMKNLLEALPRMCRYSENGCKDVVAPEQNGLHDEHEKFCGMRPATFFEILESLTGQQQLLARDLRDYYSNHAESYVDENIMIYALNMSASSTVTCRYFKRTDLYIIPIFACGTFFCLRVDPENVDSGLVELSFVGYFIGKPAEDVFIRLRFERDDVVSTFTLKAALDGDRNEEFIQASQAKVNCSYINQFVVEETLRFSYDIFTKPN